MESTSSVEMKTEIKAVRTFECLLLQRLLSVMIWVNKYRVKWILFVHYHRKRVIYEHQNGKKYVRDNVN